MDSPPSFRRWPRLSLRLDETSRVGVGADSRINVGIEGGELIQFRFSKRRAAGWGAEMEPAKKGMKKKEAAKIPRHPFVGGRDYRCGSTKRRALGWWANRRINEGIEGGELIRLRFSKRRLAGWGAEMETAKKGMKKKEAAKVPRRPFVGGRDYRCGSRKTSVLMRDSLLSFVYFQLCVSHINHSSLWLCLTQGCAVQTIFRRGEI